MQFLNLPPSKTSGGGGKAGFASKEPAWWMGEDGGGGGWRAGGCFWGGGWGKRKRLFCFQLGRRTWLLWRSFAARSSGGRVSVFSGGGGGRGHGPNSFFSGGGGFKGRCAVMGGREAVMCCHVANLAALEVDVCPTHLRQRPRGRAEEGRMGGRG